jgi:ribonuclease HI
MKTQRDYERMYRTLYRQYGVELDELILAMAPVLQRKAGAASKLVPEGTPPVAYTIIFDGGTTCGNPGLGYGSYVILKNGKQDGPVRRRSYKAVMTNNEAEYNTLIAALKEVVFDSVIGPEDTMAVKGDSKLVIYQTGIDPGCHRPWKCTEPHLRRLRDEVLRLGGRFKWFETEWWPRKKSVELLGH